MAERELDLDAAASLLRSHAFRGWYFGDSIGFEGLVAATDLTGDSAYAGFVHGFGRAWFAARPPASHLDHVFAGKALTEVATRAADAGLLADLRDFADELLQRLRCAQALATFDRVPLTLPAGGDGLPPDQIALLSDPGPGSFVDSMHFDPPFLAAIARATNDEVLLQQAVNEALAYARLLQHDNGLFHHFFLERTGQPYILGWSRGQGWALLGLLDVLLAVTSTPCEGQQELRERSRLLIDRLIETQDDNGHWPALFGSEAPESSAASFFTAGFLRAVRAGVVQLDLVEDAAVRAWSATVDACDDRGMLRGVSAAVGACTSPAHYVAVSVDHLVPWGQGPVLVAARERQLAGRGIDAVYEVE